MGSQGYLAANVSSPSRKRKKDTGGNSEIIRAATPTTGPEGTGWESGGTWRGKAVLTSVSKDRTTAPKKEPQHGLTPTPQNAATGCSPIGNHCALHSLGDNLTSPVGLQGKALRQRG